jgi:hypothetical protein
MFGTRFERSFATNTNHNDNPSKKIQYLGSGCWSNSITGMFLITGLKIEVAGENGGESFRGTIYVQ